MPEDHQERILAVLESNERLLQENNELLRKAERREKWRLVGKVIWLAIVIGVPVWLYFQYLEPTLESLQRLSEGNFSVPASWQEQMQEFFDNSNIER